MLRSKELRARAWNALKGKYWLAFAVVLVTSALAAIGSGLVTCSQNLSDLVSLVDPSEMDAATSLGALFITGIAAIIGLVGFLLSIFVGHAATVGLTHYFIENTDSTPSFADAFTGFKTRYGRNVGTLFLVNIKIALWSLLFVIPGFIKAFEYAIIPYILADDPEISSKDAFKKARAMMKGS